MNKRDLEEMPYGVITEELIQWRAENLLRAILGAMERKSDKLPFAIIKDELWDICMEATYTDRDKTLPPGYVLDQTSGMVLHVEQRERTDV